MVSRACVDLQQSHNLMLPCGCMVYVSCHPLTGIAHTRVIERRGAGCPERLHDIGVRPQAGEWLDAARRTHEWYDPCRVRR